MNLTIASAAAQAMLDHAATKPNEEVCGLLLGNDAIVEEVLAADNVATDRARRFEIDPAQLLATHRRARAEQRRVVGHYHSHPSGTATPSLRDAAAAIEDGLYWLIVANGALAGFVAQRGGVIAGRFDSLDLVTG